MQAAPINPADVNQVQGVYPLRPPFPAVGGTEGYGKVEAVGSKVTEFKVGDLCVPERIGLGTWRSHMTVIDRDLMHLDMHDLPVDALATFMANPPTAYRMLRDFAHLGPGDVVIQNAAESSVGRAVIQIAKQWSLRTINVFLERKTEKETEALRKELIDLGGEWVITEGEARKALKGLLKQGHNPKLALNYVGGDSAAQICGTLDHDGVMVTIGAMSKQSIHVPTGPLIFKDVRLFGFWMVRWYKNQPDRSNEKSKMYNDIAHCIRAGKLKPAPCDHVPIQDWKKAFEVACSGFGKKQLLILNKD